MPRHSAAGRPPRRPGDERLQLEPGRAPTMRPAPSDAGQPNSTAREVISSSGRHASPIDPGATTDVLQLDLALIDLPLLVDSAGVADINGPLAEQQRVPSKASVLRSGSWNAGAQLAPLAVNLIMTPFVIHGFGKERFGLYMLALTISDFLGTFDGGIYGSSQRFFAIHAGAKDRKSTSQLLFTLIAAVFALGVVLAGTLAVTAPWLIEAFRVPHGLRGEGAFLLKALGVLIAVELIRSVFTGLLNAHHRFALASIVTTMQYGVYTVGVIATVHNHWGLRGIAITLLIQNSFATVVFAFAVRRHISFSQLRLLPRARIAEFWKYSSRAQLAGLSDLINLQSDSMIIGGFLNVGTVAVYSSGRNFASQLRNLPSTTLAPSASVLGQTYGQLGPAAVLAQFRRLQRSWVQGCSGWIAVGCGAAYFGVTKWLGHGFRLAGVVAVVLLVGYLFRLWVGMLLLYCQTLGHPELEARFGVVSVVVNLTLTLALVVPFGVLGVVAATAAAQLFGSVYLLRLVRSRLGQDVPSFFADVPWLASALAAGLTVALERLAWSSLHGGALGLLEAGVVAAPGLIVFAIVLLGPAQAAALARRRLTPVLGRTSYGYQRRHGHHG